MSYTQKVLDELKARYPEQPEFIQAATEILGTIQPALDAHPEYEEAALLERLVEPERIVMFRVPWVDDQGKVQVNRGYRVEFNSAIGPYKGGLRFNPTVTLGMLKFLGLEQILKNSLTTLPMGGGKVLACSDTHGWVEDPDGIDYTVLEHIYNKKRSGHDKGVTLAMYVDEKPNAVWHEGDGRGVWQLPCDIALPCARENTLLLEDAQALVANGCKVVGEGANMPTTIEATTYFQENGVAFMPGKAANAGGVLVSGLEMSQNAEHLSWTFEEVDGKLEQLMRGMFHNVDDTAKEYGQEGNFVMGANIAGFLKVADAMLAQGVC